MSDNPSINRRLLLVDDEESILSALTRTFCSEGYTIYKASNAKQGLELLEKYEIAVIISDQRMPGMTGIEFLTKVKQSHPHIIRLILSGFTDVESILKAINEGAIYKFLTKPWNIDLLKTNINEAFEYYEVKETNRRLSEELKVANKFLEFSTEYERFNDALTDLPNRLLFIKKIDRLMIQARERNEIVAVFVIDIDRFKNINDSLGHSVGDELLIQFGNRLMLHNNENIFNARIGGNEFGVILSNNTSDREIKSHVEKIKNTISGSYSLKEREVTVTVSIGIYIVKRNDKANVDILKNADTAMHQAKKNGKNNYIYYEENMSIEARKKLELEKNLRKAIENEEFILYYQPQISLKTNKLRSVEALIRWDNPLHGIVSPIDFIPMLEETGLIIPVGEWVIKEAFNNQMKLVELNNGPECISINISGKQFLDKRFLGIITDYVKKYELSPNSIELEITESILIEDISKAKELLNNLKDLGIKIAIDDFGTGYSSLSYLKSLPIDVLKLDMSFVKEIEHDADSLAIASAVISLGHDLGMEIVAEGVETANQLTILSNKKCDLIQGYFFSKPLPYKDLEVFIRNFS